MDKSDLDDLPVVIDVPTAAEVLGIGRTSAYELVRTGQWPTPVLRLGRSIRIPSAPLLAPVDPDAVGVQAEDGGVGAKAGGNVADEFRSLHRS